MFCKLRAVFHLDHQTFYIGFYKSEALVRNLGPPAINCWEPVLLSYTSVLSWEVEKSVLGWLSTLAMESYILIMPFCQTAHLHAHLRYAANVGCSWGRLNLMTAKSSKMIHLEWSFKYRHKVKKTLLRLQLPGFQSFPFFSNFGKQRHKYIKVCVKM